MVEQSLIAAFLVGLLGGVHCAGMCGGIVAALTMGASARVQSRMATMAGYQLAYNLGRIVSYVVAGALIGGLGGLISLSDVHVVQLALKLVAGLFLIALGLYLGGWWYGLTSVERLGARLWRYIEPLGRRLLPIGNPWQAMQLGLVWGWLPCGLVYSVLIWTLSAGSALHGAALMTAFGLGTLPNLLGMGMFSAGLTRVTRAPLARRLAGALVVVFGVYSLYQVVISW